MPEKDFDLLANQVVEVTPLEAGDRPGSERLVESLEQLLSHLGVAGFIVLVGQLDPGIVPLPLDEILSLIGLLTFAESLDGLLLLKLDEILELHVRLLQVEVVPA